MNTQNGPEELFSVEAEQQLLGGILVNNDLYYKVSGFLKPEHFYDPVHADIYRESGKRIEGDNLASLKVTYEKETALVQKVIEARKAIMDGGERVHLLGRRDDVPALLAALDLFALPSRCNEGVPQAIVQAMAMGLPIVTTDAGSIPEAIRHEHNGLIAAKGNADALAAGLSRILDDADLARRLGRNARADALAHHTLEATLDRMDRLMRAAIASRA